MSMSPRRSTRISNAPQRYEENFMSFMLSLVDTLPKSFSEASHSKEHGKSMHVEYDSMMKYDLWSQFTEHYCIKAITVMCLALLGHQRPTCFNASDWYFAWIVSIFDSHLLFLLVNIVHDSPCYFSVSKWSFM